MNSFTHEFITKIACQKYKVFKDGELIEHCTKPDTDETDGAFKYHFYNPVTRKNFSGGRTSALTKILEHYNNAIILHFKNDKKSIEELGRALHFMQDICTPVHTYYEDTTDAINRLSQHQSFEKHVDKIIKENKGISITLNYITTHKKTIKWLGLNSIKTFAEYYALKASELFHYLDKKIKKPIDEIAIESVQNGIIASGALLIHFINDIERDAEEWIVI